MRLKLLFTLGFVLCLRTLAAPEGTRCGRHSSACNAVIPATAVTPVNGEHSTLLISRLLYI
jgi:hypothetical protein